MDKDAANDLNTEYKHLRLDPEHAVAYRDSGGNGPVVLFLHDFASFSHTWNDMLRHMPSSFRYIRVDLNGFGFSLFQTERVYSNFDHAELLRSFILTLNLRNLTLVGQGVGGDIALLLACNPEILARMNSLVLITCGGLLENIPEYIATISTLATGHVLRLTHSRFLAQMMLRSAYAETSKIAEKTLNAYSAMLAHPGRLDSIILAAREYKQPDPQTMFDILQKFELPVLLIYGDQDEIVPPGQMAGYARILRNSTSILMPGSGHLPQEEFPEETARLIGDFIRRRKPRLSKERENLQSIPPIPPRVPHLSRLFDRWSAGALFLIFVLKILQFFRLLGMKAEAQGWRKITSIFLRGEYSKFVLASFRLNYAGGTAPETPEAAKTILRSRLYDFLVTKKELHWSVEPGIFSFGRHKITLCDIVEAEVAPDGTLLSITPFFDTRHNQLVNLTGEQIRTALENIIRICNQQKNVPNRKRPLILQKALKKWAAHVKGFSFLSRRNLYLCVERIMASTFLYVEQLPRENAGRKRLETPDIRIRRHPGWGMLSVTARLTADLRETDLWFQFHHMNADGAPMQELMTELKQLWGSAGNILYPPQKTPVMLFETMDCGEGIFRTRLHIDFTEILALRKRLNEHYMTRMNGTASLAGLLLWGLAGHNAFRDKKMLLPVDLGTNAQGERELGLLFIRPGLFRNDENPFEGFLNFQKELNLRMNAVRTGRSESHEFLSLCSMLHPIFCHMARILAPRDLHEIVGSMGLSIIRDAEMFISPLTDFQTNGFVSLGSAHMETENGRFVGSLCICGTRHHIRNYLQAIRSFILHFSGCLNLPET